MRPVYIGKTQAGNIHTVSPAVRFAKPLRRIFGIRVDQRRQFKMLFHGRKRRFIFIYGIGTCQDEFFHAILPCMLQQIHRPVHIHVHCFLRIGLAVRQRCDSCNMVDIISATVFKQGIHSIPVPDIHADHFIRKAVVFKFQVIRFPVREVIHQHQFGAFLPELVSKLGTNKSRSPCNHYFHAFTLLLFVFPNNLRRIFSSLFPTQILFQIHFPFPDIPPEHCKQRTGKTP